MLGKGDKCVLGGMCIECSGTLFNRFFYALIMRTGKHVTGVNFLLAWLQNRFPMFLPCFYTVHRYTGV